MKKLTVEIAQAYYSQISESIHDPESAHSQEYDFKNTFIKCISLGMYDEKELKIISNILLKVNELDFPRWFA